jgi:small subunit ribosomal protein S21
MIKVIIGKNENINRALKRFRVKVRNTKVIQNYKTKQEFTKKSVKRRREIQKAQYIQQLRTKEEQI